jgi:hypothetical protein
MSTRTPTGVPDDADEFDYTDEAAVRRFLEAIFGPAPKPRKKPLKVGRTGPVRRQDPRPRPCPIYIHPSPDAPHPAPLPDREWTFRCPEPRFKSVAVITVSAPTHREACAQAYLQADEIAESLRTFLKK